MTDITHILYDLDGTLVDSLPGIEYAARAACAEILPGVVLPSLRPLIGPPIREMLARALPELGPNELDALSAAFRRQYDTEGWRMSRLFPGTADVLHALSLTGIIQIVVTNKPRRASRVILEEFRLLKWITGLVARDGRIPHYSSKGDMIRFALEEWSIGADNVVMVGDTSEDGFAAAEAGIRFAWVAYGYGKEDQGTAVFPVTRIQSPLELLRLRSPLAALSVN